MQGNRKNREDQLNLTLSKFCIIKKWSKLHHDNQTR